jgi:hypothetical protein
MIDVVIQSFGNVPSGTLTPQRWLSDNSMAHTVPCQCKRLAGHKFGTMRDKNGGVLLV